MRILFIIPNLSGGGAENIAAQVASALAIKHEVSLICLGPSDPPEYPLSPKVKRTTLTPQDMQRWKRLPWNRRALQEDYLTHFLRSFKRRHRIEASLSFLEMANYFNVCSARGERTVVSIRNNYTRKFSDGSSDSERYLDWARTVTHKASHVVALSQFVLHDQQEHFGANPAASSVIYNLCDAAHIQALAQEPLLPAERQWLDTDDPVIITAGRYAEQKGQWHLIRAFTQVVEAVPHARLVVLGRGPLEQQLQELIASLHLEDRVWLAGHHTNPHRLMARANVFAFPSLFEGLGNVLLEAMACGLPIVSADCAGGPRELLMPDADPLAAVTQVTQAPYGVLIPPFNAHPASLEEDFYGPLTQEERQLADALIELLGNQQRRAELSAAVRQRLQAFEPARILAQWEHVLGATASSS